MATDLTTTYYPPLAEITDAAVTDVRSRLDTYLKQGWPALDTRPGSPFGDLMLTPLAYMVAAHEEAIGRVLSDLDLENVANGTIYNCDFVEKYLKNFAVYEQATLQSSGVIRLTFSADSTYTLDRQLRFLFNEDQLFYMRLPCPGPMTILPVGSTPAENQNCKVLTQFGLDSYVVDIPVVGSSTAAILVGDEPELSELPDNLTSAEALIDFDLGNPPEGLKELAKKTRETFYSASVSNRGGAKRFIQKEFPEASAVSPILSGDAEMLRDTVNPLGISQGTLDLYVKSKSYPFQDTHTIRLNYYAQQQGSDLQKFIGELVLPEVPYQLKTITAVDAPDLNLNPTGQNIKILAQSKNIAKAPYAAAGYSSQEQLWLTIDMPFVDDSPAIALSLDENGQEYALFEISYVCDPLLGPIDATIQSLENKPVGVDTLTKGFVSARIDRFTIKYTRKPGTTVNLTNAKEEIYNYLRGLGYPNVYSDSMIGDIMFYNGVEDQIQIECIGVLRWSVADLFMPPDAADPEEDYVACVDDCREAPAIDFVNSSGLLLEYTDPHIGTSGETFCVVGIKNIAYLIDKDTIRFSETYR